MRKQSSAATPTVVEKFVGTAYDTVEVVSKNITEITAVGKSITDGAFATVITNMPAIVAAPVNAKLAADSAVGAAVSEATALARSEAASLAATAANTSKTEAAASSTAATASATAAKASEDVGALSETAAATSATASATTATASATSATASEVSNTSSAASAAEALLSAAEGKVDAASAGAAATGAAISLTKASQWAAHPKGTLVPDESEYSAKHYALTATDEADRAEAAANALTGALVYQTSWDASTAVYPADQPVDFIGTQYYIVNVNGTISGTDWFIGDNMIWNSVSSVWDRLPSSAVNSVNGQTGVIALDGTDIPFVPAGTNLISVELEGAIKELDRRAESVITHEVTADFTIPTNSLENYGFTVIQLKGTGNYTITIPDYDAPSGAVIEVLPIDSLSTGVTIVASGSATLSCGNAMIGPGPRGYIRLVTTAQGDRDKNWLPSSGRFYGTTFSSAHATQVDYTDTHGLSVTDVQSVIDKVITASNTAATAATTLTDRVTSAESATTALTTRVATAEATVSGHTIDIADTVSATTDNATAIAAAAVREAVNDTEVVEVGDIARANKVDVAALDVRVVATEASTANLAPRVTTAEGTITSNTSRITAAETTLTNQLTQTDADALYLGVNATAKNADKLGNVAAADYLKVGTAQSPNTSTLIGDAEDLNDYKTPGFYHQATSIHATNGSNYPVEAAGSLQVYLSAGVNQVYRRYSTGVQYQRAFYTVWSPWKELSTTDHTHSNQYVTLGEGIQVPDTKGIATGRLHMTVGGGHYTGHASAVTGVIRIGLPVSGTADMVQFTVNVFNYVAGTSASFRISGYPHADTSSWLNVSAVQLSGPDSVIVPVRFAHTGTQAVVYLGDVDTVWRYPQITIQDFYQGLSTTANATWATGWAVNIATTLISVTHTITNALPRASNADKVGGILPANIAKLDAVNTFAESVTLTKHLYLPDNGWAHFTNGGETIRINASGAVNPVLDVYNKTAGKFAGVRAASFVREDGNTMWHAGNDSNLGKLANAQTWTNDNTFNKTTRLGSGTGYNTILTGGLMVRDYSAPTTKANGCIYFSNGEWTIRGGGINESSADSNTVINIKYNNALHEVYHKGNASNLAKLDADASFSGDVKANNTLWEGGTSLINKYLRKSQITNEVTPAVIGAASSEGFDTVQEFEFHGGISAPNGTAASASAWNKDGNIPIKLTRGNNSAGIWLHNGDVTNSRTLHIQAGHESTDWAHVDGLINLNPYGGKVQVNGNDINHSGVDAVVSKDTPKITLDYVDPGAEFSGTLTIGTAEDTWAFTSTSGGFSYNSNVSVTGRVTSSTYGSFDGVVISKRGSVTNTSVGNNTFVSRTTSSNSTALGYQSGRLMTSGPDNTLTGAYTGDALTSGGQNTAVGTFALSGATIQSSNACLGYSAGKITTGHKNTCIGSYAGSTITTGSSNSCIGYNAQNSSATAVGQFTLGDANVTNLRCNDTSIASLSDGRDKVEIVDSPYGIDFLMTVKPRQYKWETRTGNAKDGTTRLGFISQELLESCDGNNDVLDLVMDDNPEVLEAKYSNLLPIMVQSIKDLKQENTVLLTKLDALTARLDKAGL